jgi:uncharacterized membrane protein YfhO
VPVGRADFTLIGVQLPAGATDVDLTFHSATYERGKLITLLALALSVLLGLAGLVADRRPRRD